MVVRGALLDVLLTALATLPLYLYYAGPDFFASDQSVADEATRRAYGSVAFNLLNLVLGLLCTFLAAFWVCRRVEALHVRHGGWVAVASLLLVVPFLFIPGVLDVRQPLWAEVLGFIGILPAGMIGGHAAAHATGSAA